MIEQKIEKLAAYSDRILLLHKGKQIAFDTPQKVFSMPDLNTYGIQAPAFTRICKAEQVTLADGTYPVTVEEAAEVLKEKKVGAQAQECADGVEHAQETAGADAAGTESAPMQDALAGAETRSLRMRQREKCLDRRSLLYSPTHPLPVMNSSASKIWTSPIWQISRS